MNIQRKNKPQRVENPAKQQGITLVVVMVILVAMTFLGLGAMSDSNMQLALVRNSQLQNMAYSAAMTEVNAQIDLINAPGNGMNDPAVVAAVNAGGAVVDTSDDTVMANLAPAILGTTVSAGITQNLTLVEPNPLLVVPVDGFSIKTSGSFRFRFLQFNSQVQIANVASNSNQTQGIRYLGAN